MIQRRVVGMILALFAMVLIVAAVLPRGWWRAHEDTEHVHIGLRSVEVCDRSWDDSYDERRTTCRESTLDAMYQDPDDEYQPRRRGNDLGAFTTVGTLLFGGGLLTAALLGLGAVLAFQSRDRRLPRTLTTVITLAAAGVGALTLAFLLFRPDTFSILPYGPSPVLAILGSVIGVVAGRCLAIYEPTFEPGKPVVPGSPWIALAVLGVGATLALGSTTIAPWWSQSDKRETLELAPRWIEECDHDSDCKDASIAGIAAQEFGPGGHKFFVQMGGVLHHLSLLGIVLALVALALAAAGQPVTGSLSPARWMLGLGAVFLACALLFLGSRPEVFGKFDHSWGGAIAVLGGLGMLVGGILLGRWVPPPSDGFTVDAAMEAAAAAPGAAVPACPSCAAPMVWAAEHRRFFCAKCRVYV